MREKGGVGGGVQFLSCRELYLALNFIEAMYVLNNSLIALIQHVSLSPRKVSLAH